MYLCIKSVFVMILVKCKSEEQTLLKALYKLLLLLLLALLYVYSQTWRVWHRWSCQKMSYYEGCQIIQFDLDIGLAML